MHLDFVPQALLPPPFYSNYFFSSLPDNKFILFSAQSLSQGTKLWGAVTEILPKELIVSLPHGLRAHVAYKDASDVLTAATPQKSTTKGARPAGQPQLSELFHIGQLGLKKKMALEEMQLLRARKKAASALNSRCTSQK